MPHPIAPALEVALDYYKAVSTGRFADAADRLAPDFVCHAPRAGSITSRTEYVATLADHMRILTSSVLVAAHGGPDDALLYYVHTYEGFGDVHTAEYIEVCNGRIASSRVIFDSRPFDK